MNLKEAAGGLGVSFRTARRIIKSGSLTAIRLDRRLWFDCGTFCFEINILEAHRE